MKRPGVVKPIPVYVPPADGIPRNAVDAKWMKLHRSARHYMERRAKPKAESQQPETNNHLS